MPLIIPANTLLPSGYNVANSCRFNDGDQARMNRDLVTATSRQKFTYSFWIKRCTISQQFFITNAGSTSHIKFDANHKLDFMDEDGNIRYVTNRVFRDVSAWYSIIIAVDTTQGVAGNRVKIYVNGTQETSFSTSTAPDEDYNCTFNTAVNFKYGSYDNDADYNLDAYLAEVVFIDGLQLAPTSFGEFDEDSPTIWKPIDVSGLTFGNNGHYLDFEASDNLGNDANGGTDWTEANLAATDQSTDTPTLNYPTWNSTTLLGGAVAVYSEGNLKSVQPTGGASKSISNIGVSTGKWYIEVKQTAVSNPLGNGEQLIGVISDTFTYNTSALDNAMNYSYVLRNYNGTKSENGSSGTGWHGDWTAGDIIGIGLDMDNHRVYFSKGGQWSDGSGNWDESSPSGYLTLSSVPTFYLVCAGIQHSSAGGTYEINSGSPSYANTSSVADANGYGAFEFTPPSGYLAINSANLGSDGG